MNLRRSVGLFSLVFFFNDTASTEIYTLSLHDALPISREGQHAPDGHGSRYDTNRRRRRDAGDGSCRIDRKSTRLNSSHTVISYAVFCLKKKKQRQQHTPRLHDYCVTLSELETDSGRR